MQQEIWFQKYKILGLLGRGGTARVYLAEHIRLKSYRAIKCISKNHPQYELQRNEAFILKNLKHSCIPIIYDIEEDDKGSYIVEEYIEGVTLADYIKANGALRENIIIQAGIQLCDLIHYLQSKERPVVYVDLKPDNILISGEALKLIDFGSAIYRDEIPDNPKYSGTRGYAAPELYRQDKIDGRCDIYGIGMLLYYMASGISLNADTDKGTCKAANIDQICSCSNRLKNIINHCLKFNPSQRYPTVTRLSKQLSAAGKNQFLDKPGKAVRIAVAGTQTRIGVTHFAFRLCNYYHSRKFSCLYRERNLSGCIRSIKNRYDGVATDQGIFEMKGIPMLACLQEPLREFSGYHAIVNDFGCLTSENLTKFMEADIKILILGAQEWELEHSEKILNMVAEYKDIFYLFNFLSGKRFRQVLKNMNQTNSFRIPYEPDPFTKINEKNGLELFEEIVVSSKPIRLNKSQN